ncbi:helix-turn-helix transcriptional regulator [Ralstonia pseudosolanacearum]|uniref:helix-turn-helix transcriptional regulator n=1 Tax=Ralstonia pseudosolanacearum TaxID=1310165 RepID=UPI002003D70D|nr:helix-turn-helix transcriptional regulator [Ralstonia pseudosolanacearum]MCK4130606.1 helix-turn-helix transcriptional regulator [Ralstonia pseudosolanacearum]
MAQRSKLSNAARFGRNLASARTSSGRTQEEVAELLGVTAETIGRMERGTTWPSLPRLLLLADLYDVPVSSLFQQSSPHAKDTAEELQNQLARLSDDDRVWVKQWLSELCDRLTTVSASAVQPAGKRRDSR